MQCIKNSVTENGGVYSHRDQNYPKNKRLDWENTNHRESSEESSAGHLRKMTGDDRRLLPTLINSKVMTES